MAEDYRIEILTEKQTLGIGASMNAQFYKGYIVAIQSGTYPVLKKEHNGRLVTARLRADGGADICGVVENIGSARQMAIENGVAYVTAREDGLFAIDLSDPASPSLLCHYDTVEYATGIAVVGNLMAVSLRNYGIELIDVSVPVEPRFISLIRTGEAQSVCIDGHYVYAGVWGSKELVIADIADPASPVIVRREPLDGQGDGVLTKDGVCYAATGFNSRPPKGKTEADRESFWGLGNGLEIFDVKNPARPVRLGGVKFPKYHRIRFDMWSVRLAGNLALVSDTRNGLYWVDISDLTAPRVLRAVRLPVGSYDDYEPITGFDFDGTHLILSGGDRDVYLIELPEALPPQTSMTADVQADGRKAPFALTAGLGHAPACRVTMDDFNVRAVALDGETMYAACTEKGVLIADKNTFEIKKRIPTDGHAAAVRIVEGYVYAAEGMAGLAVYDKATLACVKRLDFRGRAALDMQPSEDGRQMLVQCSSLGVCLLDCSNPASPVMTDSDMDFVGLFYGRHFPDHGLGDSFFFGLNLDGPIRVTAENGRLTRRDLPRPDVRYGFGSGEGFDTVNGWLFFVRREGCLLWKALDGEPETVAVEGLDRLEGKPRIRDGLMVVTERAKGVTTLCDARDMAHIRLICQLNTTASPDLAVIDGEKIYIPGGHQGLIVMENPMR